MSISAEIEQKINDHWKINKLRNEIQQCERQIHTLETRLSREESDNSYLKQTLRSFLQAQLEVPGINDDLFIRLNELHGRL
jgi:dynactin complex subunit